jgi:flagellar biosynthesis protein FlhF
VLERTYRAKHMEEALLRIKRELGPDAVILSSREVRDANNRAAGTSVEVTAAPYETAQTFEPRAASANNPTFDARAVTLERKLLSGGVPMNAARTLAMRVRKVLRDTRLSFVDAVASALRGDVAFATTSRARVVALVGPTGVGKTTTIAKLAAIAALVERRSVALISIDQYRVGASEQLARYADLIGIPMECATDAASLNRALKKFANAELVLIDTSGRSPRDILGIQETCDTLRGAHEPVDVHMCVAAAMREPELMMTLERHAPLSPSRLVVTKLDEAIQCGGVLAAYVHSGLPLSHFTTGQRVPEDIEAASAEALATVLCGEEIQ